MPDADDLAGLLRNEARIAREMPRPAALAADPDLLDRAADAIEEAHRALDQLGAARVDEDVTLTVAGRVRWLVRDRQSYLDLWIDCLLDSLMNDGVTTGQIQAAREWADHVLSK